MAHFLRLLLALTATLVAVACEPADPADTGPANLTSDSAGITIVHSFRPIAPEAWHVAKRPAIRIDGDGPVGEVPLDPASVFADRQGRILVADGLTNGWDAILVYDSRGDYLTTIGSEGEGPGEFGQLWWALPYRGDSIAAFDQSRDAILIFDGKGAFGRELRVPRGDMASWDSSMRPGFTTGADGPFPDGSFLAYPMGALVIPASEGDVWITHEIIKLSPDGQSWSSIGEKRVIQVHWDGERMGQYLFGGYASRAPFGDGVLYGDGTAHEMARITTSAEVRQIIRWDRERQPVTEADLEEYIAWFFERLHESGQGEGSSDVRERLEQAPRAAFKPAYTRLLVDSESNTWAERYRLPQAAVSSVWDVFDSEGRWHTTVRMPDRFEVSTITNERALGYAIDDLGVKHVQVHALTKDSVR